MQRELGLLRAVGKGDDARRTTTQELAWTATGEGEARKSYRLDLEIGIEEEALRLILNPKEKLSSLRKRPARRQHTDEHQLLSVSPFGLFFRAGVSESH